MSHNTMFARFSRVLLLQEQYGSLSNRALATLQLMPGLNGPPDITCKVQQAAALAGAVWQLDQQDPGVPAAGDKAV